MTGLIPRPGVLLPVLSPLDSCVLSARLQLVIVCCQVLVTWAYSTYLTLWPMLWPESLHGSWTVQLHVLTSEQWAVVFAQELKYASWPNLLCHDWVLILLCVSLFVKSYFGVTKQKTPGCLVLGSFWVCWLHFMRNLLLLGTPGKSPVCDHCRSYLSQTKRQRHSPDSVSVI